MNPIDWLNARTLGFSELSKEERNAIMHFSILWTVFESRVLRTQASAQSILKVAKQWEQHGMLEPERFSEQLAYWSNRYVKNNAFTYHFDQLHFRKNDNEALVEAVLKREATQVGEVVAALLIIVYRLRNNLFHGTKWAYGIKGQLNNFTNANKLMMQAVELHGDL